MSNSFDRLLADTRAAIDMVDLYQLTNELTWIHIAPMPQAGNFADKADGPDPRIVDTEDLIRKQISG